MRFALLGDHPDGLDMARALVESGRHDVTVYSGSALGMEYLRRWQLTPARIGDLEEVLADPAIDAVIVGGSPADRPGQLRRALQSERHVLCVHPLDQAPDSAFEAAMLQADTRRVLLPLLPEALHPGFRRLAELVGRIANPSYGIQGTLPTRQGGGRMATAVTRSPLPGVLPAGSDSAGLLRLLEMERWATDQVLLDFDVAGHKPALPGWEVLRLVGGEIAEVMALAAVKEVSAGEPLVVAGRFEQGGLFQSTLLPHQPEPRWRLTAITDQGRCELVFGQGWPGPARLCWHDETGSERSETWDTWNPWPALVEAFEAAVAAGPSQPKKATVGSGQWPVGSEETGVKDFQPIPSSRPLPTAHCSLPTAHCPLSWQDEIRCLELDDAARRSVERRRTSTLEYQEASEEATFKGTMTLVGCSLIWLSLVLLILSVWLPWLAWLIVPVFAVFLIMQLLRWIVPAAPGDRNTKVGPS